MKRNDRGAAAVEFALVAVLLILLVGGLISFGIVFNANLTATHAAHEGSRLASLQTGPGTSRATRSSAAEDRARASGAATMQSSDTTKFVVATYDCGDTKPLKPGSTTARLGPDDSYLVVVTYDQPTPMLGLIGMGTMTVHGYGVEKCY